MAILDKVREVSKTVANKSGEMVETSKLAYNIRKKEKDIKTLELNIGLLVYEDYKSGHTFNDDITGLCKSIDDACAEKERLEKEKESVGAEGDSNVESVEADIPADEDEPQEVSEEDDEILKDIDGSGSEETDPETPEQPENAE